METRLRNHYNAPDLIHNINAGLTAAGIDTEPLHTKDLALVDQLHTGGMRATLALVEKTAITPDFHILDAGCGLGGSSRLLAETRGCRVTGIDLSAPYIAAAQMLTQRSGLSEKVRFQTGTILDMPWDDNTFDAVLCQHILMNIPDKPAALQEFFRVLAPGGILMLHEIVQGDNAALALPVPWADAADISFLEPWDTLAADLFKTGFTLEHHVDATEAGCRYWQKVRKFANKNEKTPRPLGPHLVFGQNARLFPHTMSRNFETNAINLVEAIFKK
ncbi:MAG TPA: class I SAM-dependent methyltransferase [Desulfotignum sp.]|nr:class I SAM-dependent methyltransferase [Desulfotignum sp.]